MGVEVRLPDDLQRFVQRQVAAGRHATEAEVVEAALRSYETELEAQGVTDDVLRLEALAGIADIEAGRFVEVRTSDDVAALRGRLKASRHGMTCPTG